MPGDNFSNRLQKNPSRLITLLLVVIGELWEWLIAFYTGTVTKIGTPLCSKLYSDILQTFK